MSALGVALTWAADLVYVAATVVFRAGDALSDLASRAMDL